MSSKNLLIYDSKSYISAKLLARLLNLRAIKNDLSIRHFTKTRSIKIRYGNSHYPQQIDTEYNNPHIIDLCANSLKFSKFCIKNNIFSPIYSSLQNNPPQEFPILLRDSHHRAGLDIQIILNKKELLKTKYPNPYWVPVIPTEYEIRIHYVNKQIIRIFLKEPPPFENTNIPIRTARLGWHYSIKPEDDEKRFKRAKDTVYQITELLNLGFGAFDMAWSRKHKKYILWEINTAPGLNPNTAELYAKHLNI